MRTAVNHRSAAIDWLTHYLKHHDGFKPADDCEYCAALLIHDIDVFLHQLDRPDDDMDGELRHG